MVMILTSRRSGMFAPEALYRIHPLGGTEMNTGFGWKQSGMLASDIFDEIERPTGRAVRSLTTPGCWLLRLAHAAKA